MKEKIKNKATLGALLAAIAVTAFLAGMAGGSEPPVISDSAAISETQFS
jgi:hypothetical protein